MTATSHPGRARASLVQTSLQSVISRLAKYKHAAETAIPTLKRNALRRPASSRPAAGRAALSPARRWDESASSTARPCTRPETCHRARGAGGQEEPGESLPGGVEAQPEAEHQQHEADGRPEAR